MRLPQPLSHRALVFALSGILTALAGPALAVSGGTLEGFVRSSDGLGLPHVRIVAEGPSGPLQVTTNPPGPSEPSWRVASSCPLTL